uniref:DUF4806 domain-containing protein n=1 Tax=Trichobilharzia regenti TaxID=157069 RepID=A0AA85J3B1_TRIRE|nr:unnamed protein product [Trichobilharzia regenti]
MDTESEVSRSVSDGNHPIRHILFEKETCHRSTIYRRNKRLKLQLLGDLAKRITPDHRIGAGECPLDPTPSSTENMHADMKKTPPSDTFDAAASGDKSSRNNTNERNSKANLEATVIKIMMTTNTSIADGEKIMRLFKRHLPNLPTNIRKLLKISESCPSTAIAKDVADHSLRDAFSALPYKSHLYENKGRVRSATTSTPIISPKDVGAPQDCSNSYKNLEAAVKTLCESNIKMVQCIDSMLTIINQRTIGDYEHDVVKLPIKSLAVLQIFDSKLKHRQYFEQIMCQLSFKVQNDAMRSTRRLLSTILDKSLARMMTYKGTSNKIGVCNYSFFQIIIDVIIRKQLGLGRNEKETLDAIVKATKNWCHDQRLRKKRITYQKS